MDWVLFISLQWIVYGSPTNPTTQQIHGFATEELCNRAADAIKAEINAPAGAAQRVLTLGRIACIQRKER
jgi:hypothetical protein